MAILFAAGELESFDNAAGTGVSAVTTAGRFDADYARSAISLNGASALVSRDFTAQTSGWLHFELDLQNTGDVSQDNQLVRLIDSAGPQTVLQIDGDNGVWNLEYWNGSAFVEVVDAIPLTTTLQAVDIQWIISDTVGAFRVYVNGTLAAEFTGDTLQTGFTQIDRVEFATGSTSGSVAFDAFISQVIVADEDTRQMKLATLSPDAAGTNTTWTGDHTSVNAVTLDDGTFIESTTADEIETFTVDDLSVAASGFNVVAVVVGMRALRAATGPQNMQATLRTGGANFFGSNLSGLGLTFAAFQTIFATNPNTAGNWTPSEVDALEIGAKSIT